MNLAKPRIDIGFATHKCAGMPMLLGRVPLKTRSSAQDGSVTSAVIAEMTEG